MYQDLGGPVAVFATKGGSPTNPDWYRNLVAHPDISAEIRTEIRRFRARTATGVERDRIWTKQKRDYPGFAEYEAQTDRVIPVVILDPVGAEYSSRALTWVFLEGKVAAKMACGSLLPPARWAHP
jgi:deazaflavin-dependent oxidoreductase (nitroreductase family)